jgi:hypothetical protein
MLTRCLKAVAASIRAALRVWWLEPRSSLPDLVAELRSSPRLPGLDPELARGVLERLLLVLPPYHTGRCVKRSLILIELWSRCGLDPRLHLGFQARNGHAWVTTGVSGLETFCPAGIIEAGTF